jgi:hypothetical protein
MTLLLESADDLLLEDADELLLEDGTGSPDTGTVAARIGRPPLNSSLRTVVLTAPTFESLEVDVYCSADPTGTDPTFAVTAEGTVVDDSTTYSTGAWTGDYGSDGWTTAHSPSFGSIGTFEVEPGQRLWLWIKTVAGSDAAITRCGLVIVI